MRLKLTILLCLMLVNQVVIGQQEYPTSTDTHIFWQPDTKITKDDYRGVATSQTEKFAQEYGITVHASVGIWSILDIPKNKRDRYRKYEKVYFAPAFERTTSYAATADSLQIEMQNLYFDMCEFWARWARRELQSYQDALKATGVLTIMYMTVMENMHKHKVEMFSAYFNDVFVKKEEGAFEEWKSIVYQLLDEFKMWATTPEECYRFVSGKPIKKGYIMAPTVLGPMKTKDSENRDSLILKPQNQKNLP